MPVVSYIEVCTSTLYYYHDELIHSFLLVYLDLKSPNILLDNNFIAKVFPFDCLLDNQMNHHRSLDIGFRHLEVHGCENDAVCWYQLLGSTSNENLSTPLVMKAN